MYINSYVNIVWTRQRALTSRVQPQQCVPTYNLVARDLRSFSPFVVKWKTCTYRRPPLRPPTTTWRTRRRPNGTVVWRLCGKPRRTSAVSRRCYRQTTSAGTGESRGRWDGWTRSAGRACPCYPPFRTPSNSSRSSPTITNPRDRVGGTSSHPNIGLGKLIIAL